MGAWNTLHLFDVKKFYTDLVPTLRGEKGCLRNDYVDFLKSYKIGGISNLTQDELKTILDESVANVIEISNQFDKNFKTHKIYNNIKDYDQKREYLNKNEYYYEFDKFFEYYIFKYCADFNPHIYTGKSNLLSALDSKNNTIANEILLNLENSDNYFCPDGMGIINWINHEDTEILLNCPEDLFSKAPYDKDNYTYFERFIKLFEIACSNKLGLIRCVDLREHILENLPKHKLIEETYWNTFKSNFNNYFTDITKKIDIEKNQTKNNEVVKEKKEYNLTLTEDSLAQKKYEINENIPNDLKIIYLKTFHSIIYESIIENRIFISYYYESGFFQGNLNLELNPIEIIEFRENPKEFINTQSKLISNKFVKNHKERNIKKFIEKNHSIELINKWKTERS